jgi:GNAT superfamily N-acetyltransferase
MLDIREIRKEELKLLLLLYTELHDNPFPLIDDRVLRVWESMQSDPGHHVIGGFLGKELVSSCILLVVPNLTHGQRPYALIENVITAEKARGKGYAGEVLSYARQEAVNANCYKIMLMTGSKKDQTLGFYERNGYNRTDKTAFIQWLQ